MKRKMIALLLCLALALLAAPASLAEEETVWMRFSGTFHQDMARDMLRMVNDLRTGGDAWYWNESNSERVWLSGLQPLNYDYELERVAMQRAMELVVYYSHTRPNGSTCYTAYPSLYDYTTRGENAAYGYYSTESMFSGWAEENLSYSGQGHRRNMLDRRYTAIGIACVEVDGKKFWIQEFSSKYSGAAAGAIPQSATVETLPWHITSLKLGGLDFLYTGNSATVNQGMLTATTGERVSFPCEITNLTLSSSNSGVLQVSGRTVYGRGSGFCDLTARASSLSASARVRVLSNPGTLSPILKTDYIVGHPITMYNLTLPGATRFEMELSNPMYNYDTRTWSNLRRGEHVDVSSYYNHGVTEVSYTLKLTAYDSLGPMATWQKDYTLYPEYYTLSLPSALKWVQGYSFSGTSAWYIRVPSHCATLSARAFSGCQSLRCVYIPKSVVSISKDAFAGCPGDMVVLTANTRVADLARSKGLTVREP